jgi:hypothetical protein
MDIRKLLTAGRTALRAEKAASEQEKLGHPRVGSAGIVVGDDVFGTCHRKALARSLGIEFPAEEHTEIMWEAGIANEWSWQRLLTAAGCKIKPSDKTAVRRPIEGVPLPLLGSPDLVLVQEPDGREFGLELKGVFGYSTAALVWFENTPKNENLIQAATYAWALGRPYALCYTSASYVPVNFYDQKKYGGIKSIKPFQRHFYLEWREGDVLWYRDETQEDWVRTNITPKAIQDYYRLIEVMKAGQDLGPRVTTNYVNGKDDKWGPHGACGLCELARACDKYELDYDYVGWVQHIKTICAKD